MGTTWSSNQDENKSRSNTGRLAPPRNEVARIGRDAASVWTRADKIGVVASFALLSVLLVVSACSKEDHKPPLVGATSAAPSAAALPLTTVELPGTGTIAANEHAAEGAVPRKAHRKPAANVKYSDANSGVSFMYPRKATLASGAKSQVSGDASDLPMNFIEQGGTAVATVALSGKQYTGTDFEAAQFRVNVNRNVSADQCPHFAFVDTSDADGEPIDAESVKVGSTDMKMTSEFAGNVTKQLETRYYHAYENGACYEYVLGLATSGFGQEGVQAVDRDEVFGRLEKILASVKVRPRDEEQVAKTQELKTQDAQNKETTKEDGQKKSSQKQEQSKETTEPVLAVPDPGK